MKTFKFIFLGLLLSSVMMISSCDDCEVKPDLITELTVPATNIIAGEPVDWDYVVESVEDNSENCSILKAIASIGGTIIDFFTNPQDTDGDRVYDQESNVGELEGGQQRIVTNSINVFNQEGIYMMEVEADKTNVVEETNEDNNSAGVEVNARYAVPNDIFPNASEAFMAKLESASAIIIVGEGFTNGTINSYKGKPIYYAK